MVKEMGGDEDDAKDVFQEVMLSIYRQGNQGLSLRCKFGTFFLSACKKRYITVLNSKYVKKTNSFQYDEENIREMCPQVNEFENQSMKEGIVREKLAMMGESCRDIIELSLTRDKNGDYMPWKTIAEMLDISYAYIRKKSSECKVRLSELVRKDPRYHTLKEQ